MAYDIRLVKIVTGELIIGKFADTQLNDVAILQMVPAQQGMQMMMLPYGYPFEQDFKGSITSNHFLYMYEKLPEGLEEKYLEACTNLTLSGVNGMNMTGSSPLGGNLIT